MTERQGRLRRALVRLINDDNLDLYILAGVAVLFTILGATGISDIKTMSSVVLALLAWLALAQIRSRRQLDQLVRPGLDAVLLRHFPSDLISHRAQSYDILLIGLTMTRTVQGMRTDLPHILAAGGRVRVLVPDPADETLMETADRRMAHNMAAGRVRQRILATLDDLTGLAERVEGRLEVRVLASIPSAGFNCLDVTSARGLVCVQHYEFHPDGEAGPIMALRPKDGHWFDHFAAEAERMWVTGKPWQPDES